MRESERICIARPFIQLEQMVLVASLLSIDVFCFCFHIFANNRSHFSFDGQMGKKTQTFRAKIGWVGQHSGRNAFEIDAIPIRANETIEIHQ